MQNAIPVQTNSSTVFDAEQGLSSQSSAQQRGRLKTVCAGVAAALCAVGGIACIATGVLYSSKHCTNTQQDFDHCSAPPASFGLYAAGSVLVLGAILLGCGAAGLLSGRGAREGGAMAPRRVPQRRSNFDVYTGSAVVIGAGGSACGGGGGGAACGGA